MRKHFLILMLLALLPLAGWAQIDISGYTVEIDGTASYVYNGASQPVNLDVTAPGATDPIPAANYDVKYFDATGTTPVDVADVKNAGTYKVRAEGKGSYTGNTAMITFVIYPKPASALTVTTSAEVFTYTGDAKTFATVTVKDGETTLTPGDEDANNDYTFVYVDNTNACLATDEDAAYILITGYGNYQGTYKYKFAIGKATIPYADVNAATPAAVDGLKYTGNLQNLATASAAGLDIKYGTVQYKVGAGEYAADLPQGLNAGGYEVRWKIVGSKNYKDVDEDRVAASYYTKGDLTGVQEAIAGITTGTINADQAIVINAVLGTDYTEATIGNEVNKDAFNAAITAIEGDATAVTVYVKTRTSTVAIGKSASKLRFVTIGKTKEAYDGTTLALAEGQFSITGWAAGDNAEIQATRNHIVAKYVINTGTPESPIWTEQAATTVGPDAGTYYVQANVADAKYTNAGGVEILLSQNYDFTIVKNAWVIERAPLTITAKPQSVAFGTALPTIASLNPKWEVSGAVGAEHPEDVYEVVYNDACIPEGGTDPVALSEGLTTTPYGIYPGAYIVQLQGGAAAPANYAVELVDGTLTITGAAFSIFATVPNTIQYGEAIVPNYIALDSHDDLATVDETKVEYIYKKQVGDEWVAWTKAQESDPNYPITRGTYTIEVKQKDNIGIGNFQGVTPECPTTPFSIVAKNITIDIPAVELWNGATKTILNQKVNVPEADYEGQLANGEHINFEFVFKSGVEGLTVGDEEHDYAITFATEAPLFVDGTPAIVGKMVAGDGFSNDNYLVTWTGGELTATNLVGLDLDLTGVLAADIYSKIKDASDICETNDVSYAVTMGDMPLAAKKWHAFVLPFNTSAAELVAKLGKYVVVNTLQSSSIGANGVETVKFGLVMDEIPAGTPFLIKPAGDTNWNTNNFTEKTIVAAIAGTTATGTGAQFLGTYYADKSIRWGYNWETGEADPGYVYVENDNPANLSNPNAKSKFRWMDPNRETEGAWATPVNSAKSLSPMQAFLKLSENATGARIFVEDFENGTTAIKSLNADEIDGLKVAEGWYTIDGIKLQGAPTQKGIYINNGKKIVVK